MPRTRHHSCWTGRPLTVACDWLTVCVKTSGFVKVCTLSIWIRYVTAFDASVQSKVIGCATVAWLAGDSRLGVPGVGGAVMLSTAVRVAPPAEAESVAEVVAATVLVVTLKSALVSPAP